MTIQIVDSNRVRKHKTLYAVKKSRNVTNVIKKLKKITGVLDVKRVKLVKKEWLGYNDYAPFGVEVTYNDLTKYIEVSKNERPYNWGVHGYIYYHSNLGIMGAHGNQK